jgi:hypothetical protein
VDKRKLEIEMKKITDRGHDGGTRYRWETLLDWIKTNNWKYGVEIGVWKGDTFKYLLDNTDDLNLIGVDPYEPQPNNPGPEKWTKGENGHLWNHRKYYNDMMEYCNVNRNGSIIKRYSIEASKTIDNESLDFVFIDGDHSYEAVKSDIIAWLPKVKKGGYIIGHDIHFDTVVKAVTEMFGSDYKKEDDFIWYVIK